MPATLDTSVLETAEEVLLFHTPMDEGVVCGGCVELWGRGIFWPCTQAEWATAVVAACAAERANDLRAEGVK